MLLWVKKNLVLAAAASMIAAALGTGCSGSKGSQQLTKAGFAKVSTAIMGTNTSQIDHVTLTITGGSPALPSPIVQNLTQTDATHWSVYLTSIPAATGYTFTIDAYGPAPNNAHLYAGAATGVNITAGGTTQLAILAQEVNPTQGPTTHVPVINWLTSSAVLVTPGTQVNVAVNATDPDANAMTYAWQDTCGGTFGPANAASTVWTAPATVPASGACQLSVTVSDATSKTSVTAYIVIQVQNSTVGNAQVNAQFNTYPVVELAKTDEYVVQQGQTVKDANGQTLPVGVTADLVVTATDPDGDPLTYTYNSSCATATFTPPGSVGPAVGVGATPNVTRFYSSDPTANCSISVAVSDGRGGVTTGVVYLSGAQPAVSAPVITSIVAPNQNGVVTPGTTYTLRVDAQDPQGKGLTFAWSNVSGTLTNPVYGPSNTATSYSTVQWTAPNPLVTPMSVTVTVTDVGTTPALSTPYTFAFASNDPCFGKADGTACQGPNPCQTGMTCLNQVCQGGTAKTCTASDACHVAGLCDVSTGQCSNPVAADGTTCNADTNGCTQNDFCAAGVCTSGPAVTCTQTTNVCLATTGTCVNQATTANPQAYTCNYAPQPSTTSCNADNNGCTQGDHCDGSGTCMAGTAVVCSQSTNPCQATTGTCTNTGASTYSCSYANVTDGASCNTAGVCVTGQTCTAGACSGGTPACPAGQGCQVVSGAPQCVATIVAPQAAKDLALSPLAGLVEDVSGFAYITGSIFQPTKTFDSISVTSAGGADVFFAQYDPVTHSALWAKNYGDASDQLAAGVAVTADGTVAGIGNFIGNMTFGTSTISNAGTSPIDFLAAVKATDGSGKWGKSFNDGLGGALLAVAANPNLNLIAVCGYTNQAATDLVPGATYGGGNSDIVIGLFNSAGALQWSHQIGGANEEECDSLAIDDNGDVYAAGKYDGALTFTGAALPSPGSSFRRWLWFAKFNGTTGAAISQASFGSGAGIHTPKSIAIDSTGKLVAGGSFTATLPFGTTSLVSAGGSDAFVAKLDPAAATPFAPVWAVRIGSTGGDEVHGVGVNSYGEVVATGLFNTPAGTPTTGAAALTAASTTAANAFVLKLDGNTGATQFSAAYGDVYTTSGDAVAVNRYGAGSAKDLVDFAGGYGGTITFPAPAGSLTTTGTDAFLVFGVFQ